MEAGPVTVPNLIAPLTHAPLAMFRIRIASQNSALYTDLRAATTAHRTAKFSNGQIVPKGDIRSNPFYYVYAERQIRGGADESST